MDEYYKAIISGIDNAYLTGSCNIDGLLIAKELYEKLVLEGAKNTEQQVPPDNGDDHDDHDWQNLMRHCR